MDGYDVDSPPIIEVPNITGSETLSDDGTVDDQLSEDGNSSEWYDLSLHDKWTLVVERLIKEELRWDDDEEHDEEWNPGVPVLNPRERESLAAFNDRNTAFPTVLHRLADSFKNDDFNNVPQMTQVKIVKYLLGEHRKARARAIVDLPEEPILTRAFTNQNDEFIRFVIKNFSGHLPDLVGDQDSNGSNCLHYVFKRHLPEAVDDCIRAQSSRRAPRTHRAITLDLGKTIHYLNLLIRVAKPESIVASDGEGNTPMHYAMAYKVCRMPTPVYKQLALQLIEVGDRSKDRSGQFNNGQESPYLYFERTKREFIAQSARLRGAQKPTRPMTAPSITNQPGQRDMSKPREPEHVASQLNVASGEPGSNMRHAMKKAIRDAHTNMKEGAVPRTTPSALQHNKDSKRKDPQVLKQRTAMEEVSVIGLIRRETAGLTENAPEGATPPRSSSPALEARSANAGIQNSGRAAVSSRATLMAESPSHGNQTGWDPASKPVKNRDEITKEETGKKHIDELKADHDQCIEMAEAVRQQLKLHYIRNKSDMEAKELLYGRIASDRNLYFDATNLKKTTSKEVADLVSMLATPGGFEDTLSYVSLPVLGNTADNSNSSSSPASTSYDANERRQRVTSGHDNKTTGRNSAVAVFDKLAESGVRKIIRLVVEEDLNSPPHTDVAIERAVRGQDSSDPDNSRKYPGIAVEIWDWKKFDLSTDVIRFASPKVSEVHLYWNGNQTVIKGWGNEDGIPRLFITSGKALKTVTIHWSPGFEVEKRCESLLKDLKKQVEKRTLELVDKKNKQGVTVHYNRHMTGKNSDGGEANHSGVVVPGNLRAPPEHGWIESMRMFRQALVTLHEKLPSGRVPDRVKVALIDDGVDRANLNTYRDQVEVRGMSYCTSLMGPSIQNPSWHQSTHGHGTIMANSIIRLNPWVSLYCMRIRDDVKIGPQNNVDIYIHADSAARAIEDAIILKVDIISISWTIHNLAASDTQPSYGQNGDAIEALKKAINRAKKHGILIFCSASDDIKKKGTDTLPYTLATDYIFRIGAADAYGWSDKSTEDHRAINFFLPGNKVVDDHNPRLFLTEELKYRDGSSIATALAAGLASLVLYLVNLMKIYHTGNAQNLKKMSRYAVQLRTRDGLKRAFENIITDDNYKDKKFLPVWDLFGSRAKEILDKAKDIGSKWDLLDELCTKLAA